MPTQVKPFDFAKLPKYSSYALGINQALQQRYPQIASGDDFSHALLDPLEKTLGVTLQLKFLGMEEVSCADFQSSLASPCLAILLKAQPSGHKVLLDIDFELGLKMVNQVLSQEERAAPIRQLSPIEEGVLEYLLVKSLSQVKAAPGILGPIGFKISRITNDPRHFHEASMSEEPGLVFKFYLSWGDEGGFVRLYTPHPLLEGVFMQDRGWAPSPEEEAAYQGHLERVSHIKTTLWTEIGKVGLMASEKAQLEKGDVILFDETLASKGPQGINGKAVLRVGENPSEGLLAEIIDAEGKLTLKILDFYGGD